MNEIDDLDSGLLGIALSDSDAESGDNAAAAPKKVSQEARTAQSEADFQAVKRTYQARVENGEVSNAQHTWPSPFPSSSLFHPPIAFPLSWLNQVRTLSEPGSLQIRCMNTWGASVLYSVWRWLTH